MNKKGLSDVVVTILMIILVMIILVMIILVILIESGHPTYNITKQECHLEQNPRELSVNYVTHNFEVIEPSVIDFNTIWALSTTGLPVDTKYNICNLEIPTSINKGGKTKISYYPEYSYDNEMESTGNVLICFETDYNIASICVNGICKNSTFNKTDCSNFIKDINGEKFVNPNYMKKTYFQYKLTKQVCEDKEVDEITIKLWDVESYEYCETIGYQGMGVFSENGDKYGCVKIINKKDITQEWLDSNCGGCMANDKGECLYYKCNQYTVEVLK